MAAPVAPVTNCGHNAPRLPDTKAACQRILRKFGHTSLMIESIEQPDHSGAGRVFALTRKVYHGPNDWRRKACTIVFHFTDEGVRTEELAGWVVD